MFSLQRTAAFLLLAASIDAVQAATGPVAIPISPVARYPSLSKRNVDIPLSNLSSLTYLVTLNFGTPPQPVQVVLDTGSDELWVDPDCSMILLSTERNECEQSGEYDISASSTSSLLGTTGTIKYGKGSVDVQYVEDVVAEPHSGIALKTPLQFGAATASMDLYEGVLGMGFSKNANYTTFVDAVAEQGAAGGTGRVFSVALGSAVTGNAATNSGGILVLGGLDTNRFTGRLTGLPILPPPHPETDPLLRYWVQLDSISYTRHNMSGDHSMSDMDATTKTYADSGGPVVLDTGSSLSFLPDAIVKAVAGDLGATLIAPGDEHGLLHGYYQVPCQNMGLGTTTTSSSSSSSSSNGASMSTLDFSFGQGAVTIRVSLSEFAIPLNDSLNRDTCILGVHAPDDPSAVSSRSSSSDASPTPAAGLTTILGQTFLRGAYVVFDQSANQVFMAQHASCGNGSSLQPLASEAPGAAGNITGACAQSDSTAAGGGGGGSSSSSPSSPSSTNGTKKNGSPTVVGSLPLAVWLVAVVWPLLSSALL